jgi:excisionase family DNA binding protein
MVRFEPEFLTVFQVADILGVQPETVRSWIRRGRLPASRLPDGREYRVFREDLALVLDPVLPHRHPEARE